MLKKIGTGPQGIGDKGSVFWSTRTIGSAIEGAGLWETQEADSFAVW